MDRLVSVILELMGVGVEGAVHFASVGSELFHVI